MDIDLQTECIENRQQGVELRIALAPFNGYQRVESHASLF